MGDHCIAMAWRSRSSGLLKLLKRMASRRSCLVRFLTSSLSCTHTLPHAQVQGSGFRVLFCKV